MFQFKYIFKLYTVSPCKYGKSGTILNQSALPELAGMQPPYIYFISMGRGRQGIYRHWVPMFIGTYCIQKNYGHLTCHLKYIWNPLDHPLPWVQLSISSVETIFRNRQKNPRQIPYFSYFYACGNLTFKTRIKTKTTHHFKNLT